MEHGKSRPNETRYVPIRPGEPVVLRKYEVTLMPDEDTKYEPMMVTLRYRPDEANELDPRSTDAYHEAFRRACKIERREHTSNGRRFLNGGVMFVRERLATAK